MYDVDAAVLKYRRVLCTSDVYKMLKKEGSRIVKRDWERGVIGVPEHDIDRFLTPQWLYAYRYYMFSDGTGSRHNAVLVLGSSSKYPPFLGVQ
jgi:hypothetical protein